MNARQQYRGEGAIAFRANPADPRHGTPNGYTNLGCRCDGCRAAVLAYRTERGYNVAWRRRQGMQPAKRGRTHGLIATYNNGCRCDGCREAARVQRARMRANARERQAS